MTVWGVWEPQPIELPCPECPPNEPSVYWPAGLAKRVGKSYIDERRNEDCPHTLRRPAYFRRVTEDHPRAEWVDIDWDPPETAS